MWYERFIEKEPLQKSANKDVPGHFCGQVMYENIPWSAPEVKTGFKWHPFIKFIDCCGARGGVSIFSDEDYVKLCLLFKLCKTSAEEENKNPL